MEGGKMYSCSAMYVYTVNAEKNDKRREERGERRGKNLKR